MHNKENDAYLLGKHMEIDKWKVLHAGRLVSNSIFSHLLPTANVAVTLCCQLQLMCKELLTYSNHSFTTGRTE